MKVLTDDGLTIYDENLKKYIKENSISVDGSTVEKSEINGNLKINGVETVVYTPTEYYVEY